MNSGHPPLVCQSKKKKKQSLQYREKGSFLKFWHRANSSWTVSNTNEPYIPNTREKPLNQVVFWLGRNMFRDEQSCWNIKAFHYIFRGTTAGDCQPEHYIEICQVSRHLTIATIIWTNSLCWYYFFPFLFRWVVCKVKDIMEASGCWWLSVKFSTITVFKIISV